LKKFPIFPIGDVVQLVDFSQSGTDLKNKIEEKLSKNATKNFKKVIDIYLQNVLK